ncbi:MAG: YcaO-like family protein [Reyranella sp.]|uniref:YcaO-like family protein n=1 Tax=Reyranella sp. TaxID=1929291 RepID=UPI003D14EA57
MAIPVDLLRLAASAVAYDPADRRATPLLGLLGWDRVAEPAVAADRSRLLAAASECVRVFPLRAPDAPGLHCFGAEVDLALAAGEPGLPVIGSSGVAAQPGAAFAACIGEAVELRAQVLTPAQRTRLGQGAADEVTALRWPDGAPRAVPLDRCLRRIPHRVTRAAAAPLSIGCAAGRTRDEAMLRAALELVERDAVALWWRGGRAGRPVALEASAQAGVLLGELRRGLTHRHTWLLDIASDLDVPVVAAVSLGSDGTGFSFGTAARPNVAEAACAAVLELCQNELAHAVASAKREQRGEAGLNPRDKAILSRTWQITGETAWLIHPTGAPRRLALSGNAANQHIASLRDRLEAAGLELLVFDHSEGGGGMPVWRALSPGLACEPSIEMSPRLQHAIAETGGGPGHRVGVSLYA